MWRFVKRLGISTQLTIVTFMAMLVTVGLVSSSAYSVSTRNLRANQYDLVRNVVERTDLTLNAFQEQINTLLLAVGSDERLLTVEAEEAERILHSYAQNNSYMDSLYVLRPDGQVLGVPTYVVRTLGRQTGPLIREIAERRGRGIWWTEPYKSPMSGWTVTVGMRVTMRDGILSGVVAVDIPLLKLKNALTGVSFQRPSTLFVITPNGQPVIANPDSPLVRYQLFDNQLDVDEEVMALIRSQPSSSATNVTVSGQPFLAMVGSVSRVGWRTVVLYSDQDLVQAYRTLRRTSLQMMAVAALISLVLAWFVAKYFARPLERLAAEMGRVRMGSLQGIHVPNREDEVGQLAQAFDDMMRRVRHLVRDLQTSESRKKDAEIRSLQSQIKPHFLYNTLNAIGHAAALGRTDDVYTMIQSLTNLLSFTFTKVKDKVSLAEEMEHLDHYIRLQRIRYGGGFVVTYDMSPEAGGCEVLKLTLQPLVENAIFHGLAKQPGNAAMHIVARIEEDKLVLKVIDNGPGIPPSRLKELEEKAPRGGAGNMGLRNVRERLELHYGEDSRLDIESSTGAEGQETGTTITVVMPFRPLPRSGGGQQAD